MPTRFHDVQRFRQGWVWAVLAPAVIIAWTAFIQQIIIGSPFGTNPGPDFAVWLIWLIAGIGLPVLLWKTRLEIRVHDDRLEFLWFPFVRKSLPFPDIESAESVTYRPVREYGGWGIKYGGRARGWAYSTQGDRGVFITCRNGKCFLLGTERADELEAILRDMIER